MSDVFHLGLTRADLAGAELAIVPGDPGRVERIAALFDDAQPLAATREFTTWRGTVADRPIVATSTGIGGPSTSIAVEELAQLGVRTFLRVGTTGAIQPDVDVGTVIVTTGSIRLDGASRHFAPIEYPAVADFDCTTALVGAARSAGVPVRVGVTASVDTFYPGQERYDTVSGHVPTALRGSRDEWQQLGALNYEMESATLLTMCAANRWRAGCVAGVILNRHHGEIPEPGMAEQVEDDSVRVVVGAAARLLDSASDRN